MGIEVFYWKRNWIEIVRNLQKRAINVGDLQISFYLFDSIIRGCISKIFKAILNRPEVTDSKRTYLTNNQPTVGQQKVYRQISFLQNKNKAVDQQLANCWRTVGGGVLFFTITIWQDHEKVDSWPGNPKNFFFFQRMNSKLCWNINV